MSERSSSLADVSDAELLERFVSCRDEAAFAALMARHGPMVFGVCRRLLRGFQDAEDAFQAVFLILVRRAADIGRRELLGNWLYGVALRMASRAQRMAIKRHMRETAGAEQLAVNIEPAAPVGQPEVLEEVQRLPGKYRVPIVLCYLEGRTNEEAAGELRCPVGTVKTRLSRAREMLRLRLIRRGVVLSTVALSSALATETLAALAPSALIDSTRRAALCFAAGNVAAADVVSAQAAVLTKGVLHTMFVTKMKMVAALTLIVSAIVGGAGALAYHSLAPVPAKKKTDKENIQGTWIAVSLEKGGKQAPEEVVKRFTVVITADKVRFKMKDKDSDEGICSYKLDASQSPKVIELTPLDGPAKDKPQRAIYELKGDRLKLCMQNGEGDPPTKFSTEEGTHLRLLVLKREKK